MASNLHNLSEYDPSVLPDKARLEQQRYAVVVADWNSDVTYRLLEGAVDALKSNGVIHIDVVHVPGAFELTYASKKLQQQQHYSGDALYDAIIVLGCVIQGDTPHFDYVCGGVTQGITALNANGTCPVIFGLLTVLNKQQALDRAGGTLGNKGVEAGITAIRMANIEL